MDYSKYIGIPFKYGGRTYKELDCYGLVMLLFKELHNINLPDMNSPEFLEEIAHDMEEEIQRHWVNTELEIGRVLLFSIKGYGAHVAYVIGPDTMIHTWEKSNGVCIERISMGWKNRILGCYKYVEQG